MRKASPGQGEAGVQHSGAADTESIASGNPCQTAAECIRSRCHILYNGEGQMKAFLCRAHALLIPFDEPVQA